MKKLFRTRKQTVLVLSAFLIVLAILVNVFASVFLSFLVFKKNGWKSFQKYSYGEVISEKSDWISQKGEIIKTENAEGEEISAIEIKNESVTRSYIIICHQYGGSPEAMTEYVKHFYDLGFNVILPYLRGHGESSYKHISLGWQDRLDIVQWTKNIVTKEQNAKIVLFGVSMGANAVTLAASEDLPDNVKMVISDSCYTCVSDLLKEYVKNEMPFSSIFVTNLMSLFAKDKIGESFKNADTIVKIKDIEIPVLFVNGENDTVVPPLSSKQLYENCDADGVEELIIEGGTHGRNLEADKKTYWSNIDAFILNNLGI